MFSRLVLIALISIILLSWPLSFFISPPHLSFATVFYSDPSQADIVNQKVTLASGIFRQIFYHRFTPVFSRHLDSFFYLLDPTSHFFQAHPRETAPPSDHRFHYPYPTIFLFFIFWFFVGYREKFLLCTLFAFGLFMISFLAHPDGFDFYFYFPLSWLLIRGAQFFQRLKIGPYLNLILVLLSFIELCRLF